MGNFFPTPYLHSEEEDEECNPFARPPTPKPEESVQPPLTPLALLKPERELPFLPFTFIKPVTAIEDEQPPKHSLLPLSLSKREWGIPVYTLSVIDQRVSFFTPASYKIIEKRCDEISLAGIEKGEIYHVAALNHQYMGPWTSPSPRTHRKYTERRSFVCEDLLAYRQLILPALLLGCRVRDYEQRCATVVQLDDLRLSMSVQDKWFSRLTLKTTSGQNFVVDVKTIVKEEEDKKWTVICHEPKELPSSVRQGSHLEIVEENYKENTWQSAITAAIFAFFSKNIHSDTPKPINNWSLLERIYGSPGHSLFPKVSIADPSIRLKNGGFMMLNPQQAEAVARYNSSSVPAFVIEAPPGSGKTMTAAAMAVSYKGKGVQLFLSTANIPVNNMALALARLDYGTHRPLHIMSSEGEDRMTDQTRSPFSALSLAKNQEELREKIEYLEKIKIEKGPLAKDQKKKKGKAIWEACLPVLDEDHDIYFATIDTILKRIGKPNKGGYHDEDTVKRQLQNDVERIVIDEVSQLSEAALNAIVLHFPNAQIVLIGDSKQLAPFKYSTREVVSELAFRSALDVVKDKTNIPVIKLSEVYRAPKSLISHYSQVFYEGRLKSEKKELDNNPLACFADRGDNSRLLFWKVKHGHCKQEGTSKVNDREIKALYHIIKKLRESEIDKSDVMIISYYEAQRKKAVAELKKHWTGYEVLTVDSAQGREKRIVIVLTTRTSVPAEGGEDFFNSAKRCNVAVSRHQEALIVLGHPSIAAAPNWTQVLSEKYFKHVEDNSGCNTEASRDVDDLHPVRLRVHKKGCAIENLRISIAPHQYFAAVFIRGATHSHIKQIYKPALQLLQK